MLNFDNRVTVTRRCSLFKLIGWLVSLACVGLATSVQGSRVETTRAFAASDFIQIEPGGEFLVGCLTGDTDCNVGGSTPHLVRITKGFQLQAHQVTEGQWKEV